MVTAGHRTRAALLRDNAACGPDVRVGPELSARIGEHDQIYTGPGGHAARVYATRTACPGLSGLRAPHRRPTGPYRHALIDDNW